MVVIYAEKASLAKEIASALHAGKRIACKKEPTVGHWEFTFKGEDAVIVHGVGHLVTFANAKEYGEQFQHWNLQNYPCIPENFKINPKEATLTCYNYVKEYFDKADWLINATDADREGELIFGYIYESMKCDKPWKRVWIEDLTEEKLQYAFAHLKDSSEMLPLQQAGRARSISDWLVGINLTIAETAKLGNGELMSVGRVQTPTLALVVNRKLAITNHVKTPFWKLMAKFKTADGDFIAEYKKGSFDNENEAKKVLNSCTGHNGSVINKTVKKKSVNVPLLYSATQLQVAAGKKLGWKLDKTTKVMQELYEHKFMSYPRTSSEHLTVAMQDEITETLIKIMQLPEYSQYALPEGQWQCYTKCHFDDSKVGSHPAIIPTMNVPKDLSELSDDEKQLYNLLVKSLIRIVYPKAQLQDTIVIIDVNSNEFKASGSIVTENGWYAVDAIPDKKKTLPAMEKGDVFSGEYVLRQGFTVPPKRYTEADLIAAMELAGQNIEDEEARTLMKLQKKGLGTDATRAPIVKGLFDKQLIALKGKSIVPTEKGMFLIKSLPVEEIKSAEITGELEKKLNDISLGILPYDSVISEIKATTRKWYDEIVNSSGKAFVSAKEAKMICPMCGKPVRKTKFGWGCSGYKEGCKFAINSEILGKKLTEANIIALLEKGKTGTIKGFKSKKGTDFDAILKLDEATGKIEFEFPKKKSDKK